MRYLAANSKNGKSSKGASGFSLIELLIVVAIILIIAAVAIPNFMRSKIAANESATVQNIRTITAAEYGYQNLYGIGYSATLADLGGAGTGPTAANLVDNVLATGTKSGYNFVLTPLAAVGGVVPGYSINSNPVKQDTTGIRYFFSDQSAVIRQAIGGAATVASTPIGN